MAQFPDLLHALRLALVAALLTTAAACATPLEPLVGFDDPGARATRAPLARELAREPGNAPEFPGTIALVTSSDSALARDEVATVRLAIGADGAPGGSVAWSKLRVSGLDGLDVGIDGFEVIATTLESLKSGVKLAAGLFQKIFLFGWLSNDPVDAGSTPRNLPNGRVAVVTLTISVPPGARPGPREGRLELEGNFTPRSIPFTVTVLDVDEATRHRQRVARAIATLDQPIASLPLGKLLANAKEGPASFRFIDANASWKIDDTWERWVIARSDEVWDLANLERIGPIALTDHGYFGDCALAGPRARPCLFLVRHRSVDVIDVAERRTTARLVCPDDDWLSDLAVAGDGSRVVVRGNAACFSFRPSKDGWTRESIEADKFQAVKDELSKRPPHVVGGVSWRMGSGGTIEFSR
jgi:hypothetical protein